MRHALLLIGEIPGAQLRREKDGALRPQRCQLLRRQHPAVSVGSGEGEVRPDAGQIQRDGARRKAPADLLQPSAQRPAGESGADHHAGICVRSAPLRQVQRAAIAPAKRRQSRHGGAGKHRLQYHAGILPVQTFPQNIPRQRLRLGRDGTVRAGDQQQPSRRDGGQRQRR